MQDIIIGYCWGAFQIIVGLALIVAGLIGLLTRLNSHATNGSETSDKRTYSSRTNLSRSTFSRSR